MRVGIGGAGVGRDDIGGVGGETIVGATDASGMAVSGVDLGLVRLDRRRRRFGAILDH